MKICIKCEKKPEDCNCKSTEDALQDMYDLGFRAGQREIITIMQKMIDDKLLKVTG